MIIKIRDIPEHGLDLDHALDRQFLADALDGTGAEVDESQAHAELHLEVHGENVIARGKLAGVLTLPCSRCLKPSTLLLNVPLRMTFTPESLLAPEEPVTSDVEFGTHDGDHVDLDDLLHDALILDVPMVPLCREDCRGLCPRCGVDKNVTACDCVVTVEDPRFAALRDLKV